MTVTGVLFDFSGTLFRIESPTAWLRHAARRRGLALGDGDLTRLAAALAAAGAQPGGPPPRAVPPRLAGAWAYRDRSAAEHRAAYLGLAREVPLPDRTLYGALYARHMDPGAWLPYPDAAGVLAALRERGTPVAVVSNIGWDPRPVFRAHGLHAFVDAYVLSYEHGVQKPDARLFRAACRAIGRRPEDVLMVGDSAAADGGAAAIGCTVRLVEARPVDERPDALRRALDEAAA
ncbi:HAD family hydrolase [Streptomyces huiliensis]|uniref:HAD family hydrolase n=1 Tax=Streptomyces huiliensis TaxID=2876027 RepID=UPI001CC0FCEB|nr:HAD-IA family hydrolase [Streptomyces huiliensis]MBZ4323885.1 HAD-IA family hydrolase [Streptomyces huiliensis]